MPTSTEERNRATTPARPGEGALVWIDRRRAIVTQLTPSGEVDMREFAFADDTESTRLTVLGAVVHAVRDCKRLTVVGTDEMRTLLEREYVAIVKAPDRILEIEYPAPLTRADLVAQFRGLA